MLRPDKYLLYQVSKNLTMSSKKFELMLVRSTKEGKGRRNATLFIFVLHLTLLIHFFQKTVR